MYGNGSFSRQDQDRENEIVGYDYGQGIPSSVPTTTSMTRSTSVELSATPIRTQTSKMIEVQ